MSSSSLRQHQRKSVITTSGHSPLARNHSVGAPTPHHSSSTSFATQRSYRSLPSPPPTTIITTTTTIPSTTATTASILHEDDIDDNQSNEKQSNNVFNFDHQINNFHNSSINQKINEIHMPRSTRHLCGSIIPLQSSTSSPNIDHRLIETDQLISPIFPPLLYRKPDIKYRSYFLTFHLENLIHKKNE